MQSCKITSVIYERCVKIKATKTYWVIYSVYQASIMLDAFTSLHLLKIMPAWSTQAYSLYNTYFLITLKNKYTIVEVQYLHELQYKTNAKT